MNIGAGIKALLSRKNSEGPSLLAGLLLIVAGSFLPADLVTPELGDSLQVISTTLITYAGARAYSKTVKGDGTPG